MNFHIANPDQSHDPPSGSGLKVFSTVDGVAVFGSKPVEAGTYLYYLSRGNGRNSTPNPDDWYLVAASPASAPSPTSTPSTLPANVTITPVPTEPVLTKTTNAAIGTYSGTMPLFTRIW
jgi:outer membrane autotransporter protein